jgi:hypothetical protein
MSYEIRDCHKRSCNRLKTSFKTRWREPGGPDRIAGQSRSLRPRRFLLPWWRWYAWMLQGQSAEYEPIEAHLLVLGECDVVEALSVQAVEFFELFFRDPPLMHDQGGAGFETRPRRLPNVGVLLVKAAGRIDARKRVIRIISL